MGQNLIKPSPWLIWFENL